MSGWAAAAQAATELVNTAVQAWSASHSFNKQKAWEKKKMQNAHQWEVRDLKNAGLNPILSAGGGGASGSGGLNYPMITPSLDITGAYNKDAEQDLLSSQKRLVEEQVRTERAKQADLSASVGQKNASSVNLMAGAEKEFRTIAPTVLSMIAQANAHNASSARQMQEYTFWKQNPDIKKLRELPDMWTRGAQALHEIFSGGGAKPPPKHMPKPPPSGSAFSNSNSGLSTGD